jgi:putative ABC transport system permease protein
VPGDRLSAVINGKRKALPVVGTALSPEYVYQIAPGAMFPDFKRYGVLWMGRDALAAPTTWTAPSTDVVLELAAGANECDVIDRLDRLLARYGGSAPTGARTSSPTASCPRS